jgi:Novel toxin 11
MKNLIILSFLMFLNLLHAQTKWVPTNDLPAQKQFEKDREMILNTLFPANPNLVKIQGKLSPSDLALVEEKKRFVKKLLLLITLGDLTYSPNDNDYPNLKPWSFPMASALCHGQRILLQYQGNSRELLEYLGGGKNLPVFKERIAASHDVDLNKDGFPIEVKLKGLVGGAKNIAAGLAGNHLGSSIPLGGIGNINYQNQLIGPNGHSLDQNLNLIPNTQHGHIYMRIDQFKPDLGTLLFGMENSSSGKSNMWGGKHTAASASADQTKEVAPCGGDKWQAMGIPNAPAEYGGKRLIITPQKFKEISLKIEKILNLPAEQQIKLFEQFLIQDVLGAKKALSSF